MKEGLHCNFNYRLILCFIVFMSVHSAFHLLQFQITGLTSWAESAFRNLLQTCMTRIEFNLELWTTVSVNGTTVIQPPLNILDSILCANDCNGHGQCVDGRSWSHWILRIICCSRCWIMDASWWEPYCVTVYDVFVPSVYFSEKSQLWQSCFLVAFSLLARILGECLTIYSPPVLFFFQVEISSHTLVSLFRPGSVHSGSASWHNCDRVFPDNLCVSSFPNRFPHCTWTAA